MKNIRISLLNIVAAAILFWLGSAIISGAMATSTIIYTIILIVVILLVDQLFRMMLGSMTRVWLVESIFIILSVLGVWLVRYLF